MRNIIVLLTLLFVSSLVFGQTPGLQWDLRGFSVGGATCITPDSNIIVGTSEISKLDKDGLPIWRTPIDTSNFAWYYFIKPSADGNFLGIGSTANQSDLRVTKITPNGTVIWQHDFGGSGNDMPRAVLATSDGGCIITGETSSSNGTIIPSVNNPGATNSDCWIIKINGSGQMEWQKVLGGSSLDQALGIMVNGSGGYIVACHVESSDGDFVAATQYNTWLLNFDGNGNEIWRKEYAEIGWFSDMVRTADNNILILATSNSGPGNHGFEDAWMAKVDGTGNTLWQKNFGGSDHEANIDGHIHKTRDGNYLVMVQSYSSDGDVLENNGNSDVWMFKIDESGNIVWQKTIGESGDEYGNLEIKNDGTMFLLVNTTSYDGLFAGGFNTAATATSYPTMSDSWLLKLDEDGNLQWKTLVEGAGSDQGFVEQLVGDNVYVTGTSGFDSSGMVIIIEDWLKKIAPSNIIKVRAYLDINSNGVKDLSEHWTTEPAVAATGSVKTYTSKTTSSGMYYIDVDTAGYVVNISKTGYYMPLINDLATSFSGYFNSDSLTFALQPVSNKHDLFITVVPVTGARPGFSASYRIFYKNEGTTTISAGEILFKKDSRTTLVSSSPAVNSTNGDTLKWTYNNFAPGDTASVLINLQVSAPPTVYVGDTLSYMAIINPVATDETPLDDTAILKQRVVGSFDPNDKTENNGGLITSSFITGGSYLQYTVRFQNTGTADAINVIVRDTLGNRVDLSTLEVVTSSHPYALSIENGNQLTWTFNNIMLPASSVDEPASHGYIVYRIKPKSDVVVGEIIHNTASIYFDYNLPVLTNDALTLVQDNFSALPVQLINFTGQLTNNTVQLNWQTSHETNFEKFEIERSVDGASFNRIGSVAFVNTNHDYKATDNVAQLSTKHIFYRLKLVDSDGKFNYSKVIAFNINSVNRFTVYPNPANTEMFVPITADKKSNLQIKIVDASGRTVSEEQKTIDKGNNVFPVNTSKLKKGNYLLQIVSDSEIQTSKFIIID